MILSLLGMNLKFEYIWTPAPESRDYYEFILRTTYTDHVLGKPIDPKVDHLVERCYKDIFNPNHGLAYNDGADYNMNAELWRMEPVLKKIIEDRKQGGQFNSPSSSL